MSCRVRPHTSVSKWWSHNRDTRIPHRESQYADKVRNDYKWTVYATLSFILYLNYIIIYVRSLQIVEKKTDDSFWSSAEADADVPLWIHDLQSSFEVCDFIQEIHLETVIIWNLPWFRWKAVKRKCGQITQNSDVMHNAIHLDIFNFKAIPKEHILPL